MISQKKNIIINSAASTNTNNFNSEANHAIISISSIKKGYFFKSSSSLNQGKAFFPVPW